MFITMCLKEQQTNDNLIVKDKCFVIEIFDKCSFETVYSRKFQITVEKICPKL